MIDTAGNRIEKDIDCINFAPMYKYLDEKGADSEFICRTMGMSRDKLTQHGHMIDLEAALDIFRLVKQAIDEKDPRIFYYIGRESTRLGSLGFIIDLGRKLGTPEQAVRFSPRFNRKFNDIFEMSVYNVKKDSGILVVCYKDKPGYQETWIYDQDHWNEGIFAGIPLGWNLPYMETDPVLSRFTIEEVFAAYDYMGHRFEKRGNAYFAGGMEIARRVILDAEALARSTDSLMPLASKTSETEMIIANRIRMEYDQAPAADRDRLPSGVIITRDFNIGDLWTLKEGMVFGTPYSRVNMKWEPKPKIRERLYDLVIGDRKYNQNLIRKLEEELEASKEKTYEIERLYRNLQIQTRRELKLEKNMAGGFAHEMRNALAGAQLEIKALVDYRDYGSAATEIMKRSATEIFKAIDGFHVRYGIPAEEVSALAAPHFREMAAAIDDLAKTIDHVQLDLVRGLSITNQIREYAKMSELKPGRTAIDLVALLKDYGRRYAPYFDEIGIAYGVAGLPTAVISAEEMHLDSIFSNIILNAKDALAESEAEGPKEISVQVTRTPDPKTGRDAIVVVIKDNGPGIPGAIFDEIFEPFFSTKPTSGTGLGLGIVRKLLKLYDGDIAVDSTAGLGAAFTITFPGPADE